VERRGGFFVGVGARVGVWGREGKLRERVIAVSDRAVFTWLIKYR
jgi:hypothetical protein